MKQKAFKTSLLLSAINGVLMMNAGASTHTDQIDHQIFRDFGENKGAFVAGATNIPIYDQDGHLLGNALPGSVPMPDMSAGARRIGITTLVGEQLVVTAQHNPTRYLGAIETEEEPKSGLPLIFGNEKGRNYQAVNRNDANADVYDEDEIQKLERLSERYNDIALPRLDKMVTEVAPVAHFEGDVLNPRDYAAFARTGSGIQGSVDGSDISESLAGREDKAPAYNYLADGYKYLTGGVIPSTEPDTEFSQNPDPDIDTTGQYLYTKPFTYYDLATNTLTLPNGKQTTLGVSPLNSTTEQGDSGSGLYGYNKKTNRWELVGVVSGGVGYNVDYHLNSDTYTVFDNELLKKVKDRYYAGVLDGAYSDYIWTATDGEHTLEAADGTGLVFDSGQDVYINHNATLSLAEDIDQGSGGIYVGKEHADSKQTPVKVTIKGDDTSWEGSGFWVGDGSTLVLNADTRGLLPKLGKGTLIIQGTGNGSQDDDETTSSLSLGDGVVILAQRPDGSGKAQAFDKIDIVSGRGTLVLGDDKQIPLENIAFGYRGGRLDLNGLTLSTTHINNDDDGAQLVNHSKDTSANVLLTGQSTKRTQARFTGVTVDGEVYYYRSPNPLVVYAPEDGVDSLEYVHLGKEGDNAVSDRFYENEAAQKRITVFAGMLGETDTNRHNGELNVTYTPIDNHKGRTLLLTGGSNLNGTLAATGGTLLLSGRPAIHAIDWQNDREVMPDDTWINRSYHASNLVAQNNASIYVGRNVNALNTNLVASGTSQINVGFENGKTPVCVRSDFHYESSCTNKTYDKAVLQTIPIIDATGNVRLTDSASLNLYRTHLTGSIQADAGTKVSVGQGNWVMSTDSQLGKLALKEGASVTLNPNANPTNYNTLDINELTGQGQFNYKTHLADFKGDKINVKQVLDGQFILAVADKGGEPTKSKEHLTLLDASGANRGDSTVTLANADGVSLGAYRYQLQHDNGRYYLASLALEQEIDNPTPIVPPTEEQPPVVVEPEVPVVPEPPVVTEPPVVVEPEVPVIPEPPVVEPEPEIPVVPEPPVVVEPEPEVPVVPEPPVVEPPVTTEPPVVNPVQQDPTTSDRPVFFKQKDITSNLSNLSLTELTQSVHDMAQARKLGLPHLLKDDGENFWLVGSQLATEGKETDLISAYNQDGKQVQFGAKKDLNLGQGKLTLGGAYTTSTGKSTYRGNGYNATHKQNLATVFAKQAWGDSFVALDTSYGTRRATIAALGQYADIKRDIKSLGVNAGKRFTTGVDIEPSVGVNYDHIGGADYHIGGATVSTPSVSQVSYRAGVGISKTLTLANGATITPMLASHYIKNSGKRSTVHVNGVPFVQDYGSHHYHEAGISTSINGVGVSLKGNYATGDDHKKQTGTSLELSYRW